MFKFVVLLTSAALALGAAPKPDLTIVGGQDADIENYPYQVSVTYNGLHACGGSIVAPDTVVTVAHCSTLFLNINLVGVRAGSSIRDQGGQNLAVQQSIPHPKYDNETHDYDVAILKLAGSINLGPSTQLIPLVPVNTQFNEGTLAILTGWGETTSGGKYSTQLQVVTVPIVSDWRCHSIYDGYVTITDRMICAGYDAGGKDACQGDSGGPMAINGQLAGIISFGAGCALPHWPAMYAKVANPEINQFIQSWL